MNHKKQLNLTVDFSSVQDLTEILIDMHTQLLSGKAYHRERLYDNKTKINRIADYEFTVTPHIKNHPYREEKINGVWCCVYTSKMNF